MESKAASKKSRTALARTLKRGAVVMAKSKRAVPSRVAVSAAVRAPGSENLSAIEQELAGCTRCKLSKGRTNIVFGKGNPKAKMVFVGEAPGEQEDLEGVPFIGRSGQLLSKMIEAMGLSRDEVYICNVAKCRPPENRNPEDDEIEACSPYLLRQLGAIQPGVVVALGKFAAQTLLGSETRITELRGVVHDYQGSKLIATYHPAYLLRNPAAKKLAWEDLKLAAATAGVKVKSG